MAARRIFCLLSLFVISFSARAQVGLTESTPALPAPIETASASEAGEASTPVRLTYFSLVQGEVLWRIDPQRFDAQAIEGERIEENFEWSAATINLPLRAGTEVQVPADGKVELCFDDGSLVRLGPNSRFALETMSAENDTEFTAMRLDSGVASLRLKNDKSLYALQAGSTFLRARGPASVRIDASTPHANESVKVAVRAGRALLENEIGSITLRAGQSLQTRSGDEKFDVGRLLPIDAWEQWNLERDEYWQIEPENAENKTALPQNLALVAGDLERHGTWRDDAEHGRVWSPRVSDHDWQPYSSGRWDWVFPFGWTWVSHEPWGWAPYHYGTWVCRSWGWAWVPGPWYQPWSPGVVSFFYRDGRRCWVPLAPHEIRYRQPRHWRHNRYSIISTAVYYPGSGSYCEPRPWSTSYVNYVTNITYVTYVTYVKKKNKIVYKCPDDKGKTRGRPVRLDGAPDEAFEEVFGRPLHNGPRAKNDKDEPRVPAVGGNNSPSNERNDDRPKRDRSNERLAQSTEATQAFFKNFVPANAKLVRADEVDAEDVRKPFGKDRIKSTLPANASTSTKPAIVEAQTKPQTTASPVIAPQPTQQLPDVKPQERDWDRDKSKDRQSNSDRQERQQEEAVDPVKPEREKAERERAEREKADRPKPQGAEQVARERQNGQLRELQEELERRRQEELQRRQQEEQQRAQQREAERQQREVEQQRREAERQQRELQREQQREERRRMEEAQRTQQRQQETPQQETPRQSGDGERRDGERRNGRSRRQRD